ncbi:sensor domain-containing diguanylate cyclase [Massilia antarctica]|uniref:sensor domain-containing diguanylate cyclase n=1 Tax=Massilia antarctica TaxID=2765360 RepID=UPI0022701FC2|nr:diguanylate cyclase [Massilia sp. H27-R4]
MALLLEHIKMALGRHGLPAGVFVIGLALSAYGYVDRAKRSEAEQLSELQEVAKNYASLLRHRLDLYVSASRALAAFLSASNDVQPGEFDHYISASRMFEKLQGISSFGYLPKVPAAQADRFEAEASLLFPRYRILNRRAGVDAYFPLLYGQHGGDPARAGRLRGFDFSAVPERRAAMREAEARDEPVATRLHMALRDASNRPVVLIFAPVRASRPGTGTVTAQRDNLTGFVFSALYVNHLFLKFDDGHLARHFDLEVFQDSVAANNIVFDADQRPHALEAKSDQLLAHRAEVQFAYRTWLVYFYAKQADLGPKSRRAGAQVFAIGLLLALIASYATAAWPRYLSRKRAIVDFRERFGGFFAHHPFAVYALDPQRRFIQVNQQMAKELGVSGEALIGTTDDRFIATGQRDAAARHFDEVLAGHAVAYTTQITAANGRSSDLSIVMIPMNVADKLSHVLVFAENITDRKQADIALYESRQMLQLILDNIPQNVFWKNIDSQYQGGNRSLLEVAGLQSIDQLLGKTDADLRWHDQAAHFHQVDREVMRSGVARMRMQATDVRSDGTECWIETSKIPLKDDKGKVVGVLAVTEDITARKYMEQELFRRANFDSLTGLPNRGYFQSQLEEAVKRAQRRHGLALMYFDIDRFKQINDTYGHDVGDQVIRMYAQRIRAMLRESDFMARLGGDEFVLIVEGMTGEQDGAVLAHKLVEAMVPAFDIGGIMLQVSSSIGVAYFEAGMTPDLLLKAADQAMYDAKRAGRNCFRQAASGPQSGRADAGGQPP